MHDKQDRSRPYFPEGNESLLVDGCHVGLGQSKGIIKHQSRGFEADIMLLAVRPVLLVVPFEQHGAFCNQLMSVYVQMSIY